MNYNNRLDKVRHHVQHFFGNSEIAELIYHNLTHTESVVSNAAKIANHYGLSDRDSFVVGAAAWFHDTGYYTGQSSSHELRGAELASEFLAGEGFDEGIIENVKACILATIIPQKPKTLLEQIVCDADLFHFGTEEFQERNKLMRKEAEQRLGKKIDKVKWRQDTIRLLQEHTFHTDFCKNLLDKQKKKNLEKLKEKDLETEPVLEVETTRPKALFSEEASALAEHNENKKVKSDRPDKGIETMFRISSNNHQRLSDMADNKAHIMITTTSIIISVLLSVLIRKLEDNSYLIIPTTLLLTICVITMVFSILATRPSLPHGTFTQEDIDTKNVNLLFFGNFYRMSYGEYSSGMNKMMNDREFLYGSLTKDVYSQGVVLGRKYRLLRVAYNVFMFGIVTSVISFVIASVFYGH
ncbi:hypothetical protein DYBT9275_01335 [Dyadobacter sp. CECT 9275]|uniref:HD/PDEase domain-containing protein n=1 Tax=Dyadobacter helix TaxID=2822344 RepID=A0A916JB26_9BACT|nr:Pycsar system effector family protein [Dyadobacter sp. CECT 9275]CAG4994169.1 hypothetical protein DYBT9275_01335 [Dyadobacter sp. CECT 9275]